MLKSKKFSLAAALFMAWAVLASGTAYSAEGGAYGVIVINVANPFYSTCIAGIEQGIKELDPTARMILCDSQSDSAKQLDQISDLLQQGVKAILLIPIDSNSIQSGLREAKDAGVPVFIFDTPAYGPGVISNIASDNYSAGVIAGAALRRGLNGKGKIMLMGTTGSEASTKRIDGVKSQVLGDGSEIEIVLEEIIQTHTTDEALTIMENSLQSVPDLAGVFTIGDSFAIGICAALQANGYAPGEVLVTSVDGTNAALERIKSGYLLATAAQPAKQMGFETVRTALQYLKGEKVEENILLPCTEVNKDSLDTYVGY